MCHVAVTPWSPVLSAHAQLSEKRALSNADVGVFTVAFSAEAPEFLGSQLGGAERDFVVKAMPILDRRLDRVSGQQYLKLAIIRRDAVYEMCGAVGRLILSGRDLSAAPSTEAFSPIRRRLHMWIGGTTLVGAGSAMFLASFLGHATYFGKWNSALWSFWLLGLVVCAIALGPILREIGHRSWFRRLTTLERSIALAGPLSIVALIVVGRVSRPRIGHVVDALASLQIDEAQRVVDALIEVRGDLPEVREAADTVLLARAASVNDDTRVTLLDTVVSHAGTRAEEAARAARSYRVKVLEQLSVTDGAGEIAKLEQWFPNWKSDPPIAELRALAADETLKRCNDDLCRLRWAVDANSAASTVARAAQEDRATSRLLGALSFAEAQNETMLSRLHRLRTVESLASQIASLAGANGDLKDKAQSTMNFAAKERARIPLLGNDDAVSAELLGPINFKDSRISVATFDGAEVYLALDAHRNCRGIYMIGSGAGRLIQSKVWNGDRILSQAIGARAVVKRPAQNSGTTRWWELSAPVVARWKDGNLVELRIGDAAP